MLKKLIIISIFALYSASAMAADGIKVVCKLMPVLSESSTSGLMIDLLKEISKTSGLAITIDVLPARRAVNEFDLGNYDILCPASSLSIDMTSGKYLATDQYFERKDYIFVNKNHKILNNIDSLKSMNVAAVLGSYDSYPIISKNKDITLHLLTNNEQSMMQLANNRVDAVIAEKYKGLGAIKKENLTDQILYDKENPILKTPAFFAMHNNDKGKILVDKINEAIRTLDKNGFLAKTFP